MRYLKFLMLSVLMSLFFACSNDDDSSSGDNDNNNSNEISDRDFSGTINGVAFLAEYAFGELTSDDQGVEALRFYVSDTEFDCTDNLEDVNFDVRGTVVTEQLGFQITTIATNTGDLIDNQTGQGVDLVSINETEAVIKVKTFSDNYTLEGQFTVTICPNNTVN